MVEQIKTAWKKLKEYWKTLPPKRRKSIALGTGAVVTLALGLVLFLNFSGVSMTVLYAGIEQTESSEIYSALQEMGIPARLSAVGQVEVRRADKDRAIGQLAMQNYPKSAQPYPYFTGGSGLTTTDMERREYQKQGLQDRLQTTLRTYDGVKSADVTINMPQESNYPWSGTTKTATASVSLVLQPGYTPTQDQVSGIKYLVSTSVGQNMAPADVAVIDAATWVNLKSREDGSAGGTDADSDRMAVQEIVEQKLVDKVRSVLSIAYAPEDITVAATVTLDYNKVVTESKEYMASEDSPNNTGVLEHQDKQYTMGANQMAQGVAGEEDNTDTAPTYVDTDGDGKQEAVDYAVNQDFAVSYVMQQIEKNNAELVSTSIAVMVKGGMPATARASLIEIVSKATGIAEDDIAIQSVESNGTEEEQTNGLPDLTTMLPLLAIVAALFFVLLLIIILVSRRGKKKNKTKENGRAVIATPVRDTEQDDLQWQQEIEAHKRQLQDAAKGNQKEDAIVTEVREFAQENPEITASLLRAWLKEEDE